MVAPPDSPTPRQPVAGSASASGSASLPPPPAGSSRANSHLPPAVPTRGAPPPPPPSQPYSHASNSNSIGSSSAAAPPRTNVVNPGNTGSGASKVENQEPSKKNLDGFAEGNQLVGILAALLGLRCWNLAERIIGILEARGVDSMRLAAPRDAMIALIAWVTEPVYAQISCRRFGLARPRNYSTLQKACGLGPGEGCYSVQPGLVSAQVVPGQCVPLKSLATLVDDLAPLMLRLGVHIHHSPALFTRCCR